MPRSVGKRFLGRQIDFSMRETGNIGELACDFGSEGKEFIHSFFHDSEKLSGDRPAKQAFGKVNNSLPKIVAPPRLPIPLRADHACCSAAGPCDVRGVMLNPVKNPPSKLDPSPVTSIGYQRLTNELRGRIKAWR
jgi:hypothetical protein